MRKQQGKVRIGFSPYTFARISVMKSQIFKKGEYDKLLKMGYNEALRFLQDTHYREEIDAYDVSTKGAGVIDAALNANLLRVVKKLHLISDKNMRTFLDTYALRYDLENIKMIIRSTFANIPQGQVEPLLYEPITFTQDFVSSLLQKENVDDLLNALPFLETKGLDTTQLYDIENALDRYYVETNHTFAKNVRGQGKILARFLQDEIDTMNIKTILRLKSEGKQEVEQYLIHPTADILTLAGKDSVEDVVKTLRKQKRTTLEGTEEDVLERLEIDLDVALLRKEALLMHQKPLSAQFIIGFLFKKEIEVKNVRTIIKGKQLNIPQGYIENLLVIT